MSKCTWPSIDVCPFPTFVRCPYDSCPSEEYEPRESENKTPDPRPEHEAQVVCVNAKCDWVGDLSDLVANVVDLPSGEEQGGFACPKCNTPIHIPEDLANTLAVTDDVDIYQKDFPKLNSEDDADIDNHAAVFLAEENDTGE